MRGVTKALPWLPYWTPRREQFMLEEKTEACWPLKSDLPALPQGHKPCQCWEILQPPKEGVEPRELMQARGLWGPVGRRCQEHSTWEGGSR